MRYVFVFISFLFLIVFFNQSNYEFANPCEFVVSGTSTMHNWNMKCTSATGSASIIVENNKIKSITSVEIKLLSESLKSGDRMMDKKAYSELKSNLFPEIKFSFLKIEDLKHKDETALLSASGLLSIAGREKNVQLVVKTSIEEESIFFEGETAFNLTDFNIDPPVLFFGTLKTGNAVKVKFKVKFKNNNLTTIKTNWL